MRAVRSGVHIRRVYACEDMEGIQGAVRQVRKAGVGLYGKGKAARLSRRL